MKWVFTFTFYLFTSFFCYSQLPECDIWLFDVRDSAGRISFHNPVNITKRKGYDNQPAFSPDGKYILYSSQRDSAGPTDIYKYEIKTKAITQFTKTSTSEYSPTFMPDDKGISVIMVEKDSAQRLWKFPLKQGEPVCIMNTIKSIGYHSWINKDSLAIFVLTKPSFTLQLVNIHSQAATIVADSIGRCMRMKAQNLWYTTKSGNFQNVYSYDLKLRGSSLKGMIESEDYLFYKNEIWSCSENSIVSGYMNSKVGAIEVINLESFGITKPTRIVISPDGKKLAVVSNK